MLGMGVEIREYRAGDEIGIQAVIRSVFEEYGWKWDPATETLDLVEVEQHYHQRGGMFWVLDDDGDVIGTVGIRASEAKGKGWCTLCRLYLPKSQRGKGYGKRLFWHAVEEARQHGYCQMEIWSDKTLDVSHLMYPAFGAKLVGDRTVHNQEYGEPYDEWAYEFDLLPKPSV